MKKLFFLSMVFSSVLFPQGVKSYYGVQTHFGQFYRGDMDSSSVSIMLDSLSSAGIQLIRDECYWADIEKEIGVYSFPPQVDFYIEESRKRGIEILMILNYNNPLYAPHAGAGINTEENRLAFANYCIEVIKRYSPAGIKLYEIWNEPNNVLFWAPAPDAKDYADLLKSVYPAIKEEDTTVAIIACATSPLETTPPTQNTWYNYIQAVFNNGGGDYMDAISFHMYKFTGGPESWFESDLNKLKNISGSKNIYLTEIGYPTHTGWPNITEENQAGMISRLFIHARKFPEVKSIIYYDLKNDGLDPNHSEHNFGILQFDLSAKPAYHAFKTAVSNLFNKDLTNSSVSSGNYIYKFSNEGEITYALWRSSGSAKGVFNTTSKRILINDTYGKVSYLYDNDMLIEKEFTANPEFYTEIQEFPSIIDHTIEPYIDTIVVGQKIILRFTAITDSGNIIYTDSPESVSWILSGDAASVNESGELTALHPGTAVLYGSFEDYDFELNVTVIDNYEYRTVDSFSSGDNFIIDYMNMLDATAFFITDTNSTEGLHSLGFNYAFQFSSLPNHRIIINCDYPLIGNPDSILVDLYNNGNGHAFAFEFEDYDKTIFALNPLQVQSATGWQTVSRALPRVSTFDYPARLRKISLYIVQNGSQAGEIYSGRILLDNMRTHGGMITGAYNEIIHSSNFKLFQNYPNPFNPATKIKFQIGSNKFNSSTNGEAAKTKLIVYDILGREVASLLNEELNSGNYEIEFEAAGLSSGVYFYSLFSNGFMQIGKMILLR